MNGRSTPNPSFSSHPYRSAEFLVDGLDVPYQFRIWTMATAPICVLVNENSELVPRLRVGDTLNVKYYSAGCSYAPDYQKTAIRHITKSDQGRLKGHYIVGLEILEG
jgi:hypothetical protein